MTVWNLLNMEVEWVSSSILVLLLLPSNLCTDFQVVTAQWNFLHGFLSIIIPDVLLSISKFQLFFEKNLHFSVSGTYNIFAFNYLRVASFNSMKFSTQLPLTNYASQCFRLIKKKKIDFFKKTFAIYVRFLRTEYSIVVVVLFNLVYSFLLSMSRSVLEFISKFQIVFKKHVIFRV